jgi:hypothetical protein
MYRSEAHFSRALCNTLLGRCFYQRIESGETGRGIPDIYVRTAKTDTWIELKNDSRCSIHDSTWVIRWRKGQQAWMLNYRQWSGSYCYTVVSMNDGYIIIPMYKRYLKNEVKSKDVWRVTKLSDVFHIVLDDKLN